ncbi:MAG: divergent PAP2 family protein [Clostridia bacterium]|jgi:acid phosphatase family membrane protein YuiD|nr:divergent PAP2 family protein [Clostridia bacterium]
MPVFQELLSNHILKVTLLAWATAQLLKVIIVLFTQKKWDFTRLVGAGGMPSSHSALVTALAVGVGKDLGFNSSAFALAFTIAMVVMYDAAGVRRAAGMQAEVLNQILDDFYHAEFNRERLKELLGHTPTEVLAGAALGITMGALF